MSNALVVEGENAAERLAQLGLDQEELIEVVKQGHMAFISCTENHPRFVPPVWAWGETVRALREYLLPLGWSRTDNKNYSLVIDPSKRIAIAVATGDDGTGLEDGAPFTKTAKGTNTILAIVQNRQLNLFYAPDLAAPQDVAVLADNEKRLTWILLVYRGTDEVRCELSLPVSIGTDGRIDGWRERIIIASIPTEGDELEIVPPVTPDITVAVRRRA